MDCFSLREAFSFKQTAVVSPDIVGAGLHQQTGKCFCLLAKPALRPLMLFSALRPGIFSAGIATADAFRRIASCIFLASSLPLLKTIPEDGEPSNG